MNLQPDNPNIYNNLSNRFPQFFLFSLFLCGFPVSVRKKCINSRAAGSSNNLQPCSRQFKQSAAVQPAVQAPRCRQFKQYAAVQPAVQAPRCRQRSYAFSIEAVWHDASLSDFQCYKQNFRCRFRLIDHIRANAVVLAFVQGSRHFKHCFFLRCPLRMSRIHGNAHKPILFHKG